MKQFLLRLITLGIVLISITGCATTDGRRSRAEGTGFGALIGAALGAGVGALVGGEKGALIGAGIGAGAGAGAGYLAGNAVAERKENYVRNEDQLDVKINDVAQCNIELHTYNQQTAVRIKDLDKQVAKLKSRYKTRNVKIAELKKKQDEIQLLISEADNLKSAKTKEVTALNKYMKNIDQSHDRTKMARLGQEVNALRKLIATLDNSSRQMAKLNKSLSVRK